MKSFIFQITDKPTGNGYRKRIIRVWRIVRNVPRYMGTLTAYHVSDFQFFMDFAQAQKLLPEKAFEQWPNGGYKHGQAYLLEGAGFAKVTQI